MTTANESLLGLETKTSGAMCERLDTVRSHLAWDLVSIGSHWLSVYPHDSETSYHEEAGSEI
uniref:Uncharacterized protein n=1 Tax=Rhizobium loti TaxID=381 RepID=Q8KGP4_RHILI|nr:HYPOTHETICAL PROTEIN [Mesorhizobium japonicum R7A]